MDKYEINKLTSFSKDLKLLYVEDNADARMQTLKLLDNFFRNIVVAIDGKDGLEKFKKDNFELIITDINMPNKNGIEMISDIKLLNPDIFCLIISAHNETNYFIDAIELGVDGFLMKPVKLQQFSPLIFKTIQRIKNSHDIRDIAIRQAKLASMGEMIDSIAHQWIQPIGIVNLGLQLLEQDLDDKKLTAKKIKETVAVGKNQIEHIVDTITEFRQFFRPNVQKEIISLKSIIDSSILLIKDELVHHMIDIEITGDNHLEVELNANEFKHVIINILNNSKDAFNDNNIDSDDRKIIFDIKKEDGKSVLTILDSAGGIPIGVIDNIFQSNFTTKEEGKGTGMGLYMTKQIIDKIDANIEVSNINNGACFKITI